jgi:hypothetical protein
LRERERFGGANLEVKCGYRFLPAEFVDEFISEVREFEGNRIGNSQLASLQGMVVALGMPFSEKPVENPSDDDLDMRVIDSLCVAVQEKDPL